MQLTVLKREYLGFAGREKEAIGRLNALHAFGEQADQAERDRCSREVKVCWEWRKEWKKRIDELEARLDNRNAKAQKRMAGIWSTDEEEPSTPDETAAVEDAMLSLELGERLPKGGDES